MISGSLSQEFKFKLVKGDVDFDSINCKICLMKPSFVFNPQTHLSYNDIVQDELQEGYGYLTGGNTLSLPTIEKGQANDIIITFPSVSWTASGGLLGPTIGAIIYMDNISKDILGYASFGTTQGANDGSNFIILGITLRLF